MSNKIDYAPFADAIVQSVSARQIGEDYGLNPGRDGRCVCVFCTGNRDDTLRLYPGNRGFYCFRCHQSGDVIALYRQITGAGFRKAVEDLNSQYGLNLPLETADMEAVQKAKEQAERRRHERAEKEAKDRKLLEELWDVADAVQILEYYRDTLAPRTPEEPLRQRYVAALRYLPQLICLRDCLYDEVYGKA